MTKKNMYENQEVKSNVSIPTTRVYGFKSRYDKGGAEDFVKRNNIKNYFIGYDTKKKFYVQFDETK